jgi:hypothetical protein
MSVWVFLILAFGKFIPLDEVDGDQRAGQERDGCYDCPSLLWMDLRHDGSADLPDMHSTANR